MLIVLFIVSQYSPAQTFYNQKIVADVTMQKNLAEEIADLQMQLKTATGKSFSLASTFADEGIQLIKINFHNDKIYSSRLDSTNADEFILQSDGVHSFKIISYFETGISNGIYTLLDTLGFRFYAPGNEYTYVPTLNSIGMAVDVVYKPDMKLRTFFGTFGTPRNPVIDKDRDVDAAWKLWQKRNRLGGSVDLNGHMGNKFLSANMDVIKAHTEYTALVGGERTGFKTAAKYCISNVDLQKLFIDYEVKELKDAMQKNPDLPLYSISIEQADGDGDCECDVCTKMGSVSDRDFFLANLIAKEFQKISPKAFVNLYAYHKHARPPVFDLEPNVIVQLIPYRFQKYTSADSMIQDWKLKSKNLFIYDYYGYTLQSRDLPGGELTNVDLFVQKLKFWNEENIIGASLESSYSIGATGLGLYLFSRLSWNMNADYKKLEDEYYNTIYGSAGSAVKFANESFTDDTMKMWVTIKKVFPEFQNQTTGITLNKNQEYCLSSYKAYLHYIYLFTSQKTDKSKKPEEKCDETMEFVYGTFFRMMVNPFTLSNYYAKKGNTKDYFANNWNQKDAKTGDTKFSSVVQLSNEQINFEFDADCKELK